MYHHKWLYHETHAPAGKMIRSDAEEAAALGDGYVDTPAKFACNRKAVVPTFQEVVDAGYSPRAAVCIVAQQQALADGKSEEEAQSAYELAGELYDAANPPPPMEMAPAPVPNDAIAEPAPVHPDPPPAPFPVRSTRKR